MNYRPVILYIADRYIVYRIFSEESSKFPYQTLASFDRRFFRNVNKPAHNDVQDAPFIFFGFVSGIL